MGKGDKKSKKGKIAKGSYGNSRRRNSIKAKLKRAAAKKPASVAESPAKTKRTNTKKKTEA